MNATDTTSFLRRPLFTLLTLAFALGVAMSVLGGCNTMEGAGEDVEDAGEAVQDAAGG